MWRLVAHLSAGPRLPPHRLHTGTAQRTTELREHRFHPAAEQDLVRHDELVGWRTGDSSGTDPTDREGHTKPAIKTDY